MLVGTSSSLARAVGGATHGLVAIRVAASASSSSSSSSSISCSSHPAWPSSYPSPTSLATSLRRQLHVSSAQLENRKRRQARLIRKRNLDKRALAAQLYEASKPDPVLGHRLDAEGWKVWERSELRGVLLDKDEVWGVKEDRRGRLVPFEEAEQTQGGKEVPRAKLEERQRAHALAHTCGGPLRLNFGLDHDDVAGGTSSSVVAAGHGTGGQEAGGAAAATTTTPTSSEPTSDGQVTPPTPTPSRARALLFSSLPRLMAEDRLLDSPHLGMRNDAEVASVESQLEQLRLQESRSADTLARVLDLRNASGKGIQVENTRRILRAFGGGKGGAAQPGQTNLDTGSPEAQVAVLTYRIRNLHDHLSSSHRHDHSNRRSMALLVYQRARLLRYLRRKDEARYVALLPRVGLERRAVEGEVVVPGRERVGRS